MIAGPYYSDESTTLHLGDSLTVLSGLPAQSVDCCVTSPPYFGLRDYGETGQYGLEASPAEYVETICAVFAEVRRVLTNDGTLWLNIGDSYQSTGGMTGVGPNAVVGSTQRQAVGRTRPTSGLPSKNLLGIPWRTAFALQDDGWILRNDIIWSKPNAMPESVTDRLSTRHEHVFMLSKSRTYWFDLDAVREPHSEKSLYQQEVARRRPHAVGKAGTAVMPGESAQSGFAAGSRELNTKGRNPGDVWDLPTQPFAEAHFAVMPQMLAERAILAGCKPGGTVLDPSSGSGTTGLAAAKHGRKYVGIDISRDYLDLSLRTRLAQPGLDFGEATA